MRFWKWLLLVFVLALLAARLALPFIAKSEANKSLAHLDFYRGHVDAVHFALWRGRVELKGLRVTDYPEQRIHLLIPRLAVRISWPSVFKSVLVGDVFIDRPALHVDLIGQPKQALDALQAEFAKHPAGPGLGQMKRFRLDSIRLRGGGVTVAEVPTEPGEPDTKEQKKQKAPPPQTVVERIKDLDVTIENLTNTAKGSGTLFAVIKATAAIPPTGLVQVGLNYNPSAEQPEFSLAADLVNVSLPALNPLWRWQYGVDFASGTIDLFTEVRARGGGFQGYVQPMAKELRITGPGKPPANAKEFLANLAAKVLKNSKSKKAAARVPISGRFDQPDVGLWKGVVSCLRNAFIAAMPSGFAGLGRKS